MRESVSSRNRGGLRIRRLWMYVLSCSALVLAAAAPAEEPAPGVREVIIVYKTHFDIGYTDMASNVVQRYRTTMIDQALAVADRNRTLPPEQQFVWTIPGWPMKKILEDWPGQTPERKENIMRAFREGRFVVHALPFTTHTELLEPEDLVRGMRFSSQLSRAIGKPLARDAKMTDVPSHSWILPTLLKHAGVEFLHLGCNPASRSPEVPELFWWEGPDGSRVLTLYSAESYGAGLVPPPGWPYKTWLAMMMTGDNHGPPTPEEVGQVLAEARTKLPGTKVRVGRMSDFSDAILAEKPDLPVVRGDMTDTWIHGPMSNPDGMKLARDIRPEIAATELLDTELRAWRIGLPPAPSVIPEAYEQSLLYGEHTWGGAFWWIYGRYFLNYGKEWNKERVAGKFDRIESSWDEHTAYIEKARGLIEPTLQSRLESLARAVKVDGRRIVVFNPLPWTRSGIVRVQVTGEAGVLIDARTGKKIPAGHSGANTIEFLAPEIPANGYKTFRLRPAETGKPPTGSPTVSGNILENPFFKVTLNPGLGTVQSLVDKRTGRELVDTSAPQAFGQYLYERFDRDQVQSFVKAYVKIDDDWGINELGKPSLPPASESPYQAASPRQFEVDYEQTPVSATAVMKAAAGAGVPHGVTTRLALYRDQPYIDLEVTVRGKPLDPWPEAGWICLPLNLDDPSFHLGRLGSVVDPAKDIVAGCNFHLFALNGGMTVASPGGRGVGLCPLDSPLASLGEPGCWKYSKSFSPRKPRVFINLFNNQWSTNFRLWNAGTWSSRVRLWAVSGDGDEGNLVTPSAEARSPLLAAFADGPAGSRPAAQAGLELSRRGIAVTAFGPNPDGNGLVLRLWEEAGKTGSCRVTLPIDFPIGTPSSASHPSVQPVDLRGRPTGRPIPVTRGRFDAPMRAFAPASFILENP